MNGPGKQAAVTEPLAAAPFFASLLLLGVGACFYLLARPPGTTWFNPAPWSLYGAGPGPLSALAFCLPSFIHAAALPLMTASVLGIGRRTAAFSCLAWMAVDMGFELAQTRLLPGTFDPLDMAAIACGALAAWIALPCFDRKRFG